MHGLVSRQRPPRQERKDGSMATQSVRSHGQGRRMSQGQPGSLFRIADSQGRDLANEVIRGAAQVGIRTPSDQLPFASQIQQSFGRHNLGQVRAHLGSEAGESARAMGARAFATGEHVIFASNPDLRTVAHEAAHVVQQRAGAQPAGGVGRVDDPYERHADAVAERVVSGRGAEDLLDRFAGAAVREKGDTVQQMAGQAVVVQRATEDEMWDAYLDAYLARMRTKDSQISQRWIQAFFHLERLLYQAKEAQDPNAYNDERLQRAYDTMQMIGLVPGVRPAPNQQAILGATNVLQHAATRFNAFGQNGQLNRGAWAGSNQHGPRPGDYQQTGQAIINHLVDRQVARGDGTIDGTWWIMRSDTAPSGRSLHRRAFDVRGDFIYHL